MLIADQLLALSSERISPGRLDTAITVLLLLPSEPDVTIGYDGLRKRRYRIDSKFVTELLKATRSKEVQRDIVRSPAFAHLPKHIYRRLFYQFWRRQRDERWRWALGDSLSFFLRNNPAEGRFYAKAIWRIANDPNESIALRGLACTGFLGDSLTLKQARILIDLTRIGSERAINTLSNLGELYRRFEGLKPEVRALLLDPATIAFLRDSSQDPDDIGYRYARRFCLTQMRKARGRVRAGRIPSSVE
jgi:hypothetical protein